MVLKIFICRDSKNRTHINGAGSRCITIIRYPYGVSSGSQNRIFPITRGYSFFEIWTQFQRLDSNQYKIRQRDLSCIRRLWNIWEDSRIRTYIKSSVNFYVFQLHHTFELEVLHRFQLWILGYKTSVFAAKLKYLKNFRIFYKPPFFICGTNRNRTYATWASTKHST